MAVFRTIKTSDSRLNTFFDMPDMQWHGTMLFDKKNYNPISGYNYPNIPYSFYSNINTANLLFDTDYSNNYAFNTRFKVLLPMIHNFVLGQHAYMSSNFYPFQFIQHSNRVEDLPKPYVLDKDDPDIIYFINTAPSILNENTLVKFNYKLQEVIWTLPFYSVTNTYNNSDVCTINYNGNLGNCRIWKIEDGILYILMEMISRNEQSGSFGSYSYRFVKIDCETGSFKGTPVGHFFDFNGVKYNINNSYNYNYTGTCGNSMIYLDDINDEESLFFTSYISTSNTDSTFTDASSNISYNKDPNNNNNTRIMCGFFKYNRKNNVTKSLHKPFIADNKSIIDGSDKVTNNRNKIHIPKFSTIDNEFKEKNIYVVYGCWDELFNLNRSNNDKEFRCIHRFEYDIINNKAKVTRLKMLNGDDNEFIFKDWGIYNNTSTSGYPTYSQCYLIHKNTSKYLMVYTNNNTTRDPNTYSNPLHLFKFIDDDTIKLVNVIDFAINDLFFIREDAFIALRNDVIRFISIENDKFNEFKTVQPTEYGNKFIFAGLDDMMNFWYSEALVSRNNQSRFYGTRLNYINNYTINRIEITKEKENYEFIKDPINSYIELTIISDFNEIIERDVELSILGNAIFKENSTKYLKTKSLNNIAKKIEIKITGTGEIIISANLIKSSN